MQFHPLANIFPLIEGDAFAELVADVRANGVREAVWLHEGKILDGRNRWRAAQEAGVECPTRDFDDGDPVAFVVSLNLRRRHLDESQRALVAGKLANLERGSNQHAPIGAPSVTQDAAADLLNVGRRSVQRAREVLDHGAPELVQAVEAGRVSVSAASRVASLPKEDQARAVAAGKEHMQRVAKMAAENASMRADIEKLRRLNQKRSMNDVSALEDRTWFGVEYQLDCLDSVISKIGPTAPDCSSERAARMAKKWPRIAEFFNSIMEHAHARH